MTLSGRQLQLADTVTAYTVSYAGDEKLDDKLPDLSRSDYSAITAGFSTQRKAEFLAGRYCIHRCFEIMMQPFNKPILYDSKRQPLWPSAFIGSITHSHNTAIAAVANTRDKSTLGIDYEQHISQKEAIEIAPLICTCKEQRWLRQTANASETTTLVFSAKESIYKGLYPQIQSFFGFHAVELIEKNDNTCLFKGTDALQQFGFKDKVLKVKYCAFEQGWLTWFEE